MPALQNRYKHHLGLFVATNHQPHKQDGYDNGDLAHNPLSGKTTEIGKAFGFVDGNIQYTKKVAIINNFY